MRLISLFIILCGFTLSAYADLPAGSHPIQNLLVLPANKSPIAVIHFAQDNESNFIISNFSGKNIKLHPDIPDGPSTTPISITIRNPGQNFNAQFDVTNEKQAACRLHLLGKVVKEPATHGFDYRVSETGCRYALATQSNDIIIHLNKKLS